MQATKKYPFAHPGVFTALTASLFIVLGGITAEAISAEVLVGATATGTTGAYTNTANSIDPFVRADATQTNLANDGSSYSNMTGAGSSSDFLGRAYSQGFSSSSATYHREFTIQNDSLTDTRSYTLSSLINQGSVSTTPLVLASPNAGNASFLWTVGFNGTTVNAIYTRVGYANGSSNSNYQNRNTPSQFLANGTLYSGTGGLNWSNTGGTNVSYQTTFRSWSDTTIESILGTLAPGMMGTVSVDVLLSSYSNYDTALISRTCSNYGGPSYECGYNLTGNSLVRFGDPGDVGSAALDVIKFESVSAVPEPAEWLMMITGLGLVAQIARRRKQRKLDSEAS
jgi:hypothetical protein